MDVDAAQLQRDRAATGVTPPEPVPAQALVQGVERRMPWHLPRLLALVIVLALAFLAASPLLEPRLIRGADSLPHFYTLVQLDHLVDQGILYTRWFPHKYSGFGAPFFQYYAPLAFYGAEALARVGLELLAAFRLASGLALLGAALGTYLWARDLLERGPALVAAAAYVCGPYLLFNAYFRAGYTEQYALMLMPFALWSFRRLAGRAQARYMLLAAATYAGLVLSHTLTALIFTPWLLAYTLLLASGQEGPGQRWRVLARLWMALGLGLGLSAFFWLPAFWERGALQTGLATANPAVDFRGHFVHPRKLLSGPLASLPGPALSLVAVCLAALGLVATGPASDKLAKRRHDVWLAALGAGLASLLALSVSGGLWRALPPLHLFQFPFRFLGLASLLLAFLAGCGLQAVQETIAGRAPRWARLSALALPLLALSLLVAHTRVLSLVSHYKPLPEIDVAFIMRKERASAPYLGEFTGAYIPATVLQPPPLEDQQKDGPERLDLEALPPGARVLAASYGPLKYDLVLSSPEPFVAAFRTFFFPGWTAELDGEPVTATALEPHGQIGVDVPAGEHHLIVRFGSTPLRTAATILSLAAFCVLGVTVAVAGPAAMITAVVTGRNHTEEVPMS
jgi:hypothetical protein